MNSLRKWLYRPKRSDSSLLAQFYFADEELNLVAAELDSFEGRKDPERCTALVNQLRACQARVLNVVSQMMDETVKDQRASRDFRVKFPDDVIQENLAGQLWFGAECLAAGSSIMNREIESACMRPLARALTKNLDSLRSILREQCLCNVQEYTETIRESLIIFDKLFAEFELSYVSAMVPVKTAHEYDMIQEITVLFSETVQRALKIGLLTPEMIDEYDPALMFTIPRLAIVSGVLVFKEGPLNPDNDPWNISEMFRPFQTLLLKIRELLSILSEEELNTLERALCSQEEPSFLISLEESKMQKSKDDRRKSREDKKALVKKKSKKEDSDDGSIGSELTALEIAERLEALALNFEASRNARQAQECDKQDLDAQSSTSSTSSASVCKSDADVLKESESEQSDELQHMTSQLYFEANIDSRDMDQNTLMIQSPDVCSFGDILDRDQQNESSVDAHHGCLCYAEITATNRAQFAKSKCDSSDSGLHSEPMSNSGSMFTISSNDSGQTLITRDSLSSEDSQSALHNNCTVIQFPRMSNSLNALNTNGLREGTHEMDAVCSDGSPLKCLILNQGNLDEDIHADVTNVHEDDIMVSPLEEKKVPLEYSCSGTFSYELCSATDASHHGCSSGPLDHSNLTNTSLVESGFTHEELVANQAFCNVSKREALPSFSDSAVCDSAFVHCTSCCSLDDSICDKNVPDQNSSVHSIKSDGSLHNCSYVTTIETLDHITQFSPLEKVAETNNNEKNELSHGVCSGILQSEELKREDSQTTSHMSEQSVVNHPTLSSINDHNFHKDNQSIVTANNLSISENVDNVDISLLINSQTVNGEASFLNSMINTVCPSSDHCEFQENVIQILAPLDNSPVLPVVPSSSTSQSNHCVPELKKSRHKNYQKSKDSKRSETKKHKKSGVESVSNKSKKSSLSTHAKSLMDSHLLDSECCNSSETSSYTSDCGDQEEIALAIKAAENATRQQVRARFRSSSDMIHRLFVCISGVADQLQTNFAGDLRNILRSVFDMNCSQPVDITEGDKCKDTTPLGAAYRAMSSASRNARRPRSSTNQRQKPPVWIPDEQCSECMSCQVPFTFVRRRHHCRNCGKIFCNRCSSNFVPLPYIGQDQAVRVCNRCFMFRVTPFTARPAHQVN